MTLEQLRAKIAELKGEIHAGAQEIRSLAEPEEISPEDDVKLTAAIEERDAKKGELETLEAEAAPLEARALKIEEARTASTEKAPGFYTPQVMKHVDPNHVDVSSLNDQELRDNAFALLEKNGKRLEAKQLDHVDRSIRSASSDTDGTVIARRLLLTETPEYRSAFAKGITDPQPKWNLDELRALEEFRAMSETSANGGYGVPVLIDPTIILTSGASGAPVLDICRVITITTNAWKGVSAAPASWSYDAEASVVSDDSPTLAQPTVTVYGARGFIPFSYEIGMDYPGFEEELGRELGQGFIDLVAQQSVTGSGSSQPRGIFTAIQANALTQVVTNTDGALGAIDFQNLYKAVPERFRSKATFLMHTQVENAVRAFPTSSNFGYFTVDLSKDGIGMLQGRPVRTTDYAPQFTGTTLAANIAVFGDFSNFVLAQRAGMNVELIPNLFDGTYSRPTGQRGLFAFARHGMDSVNDNAFRILLNT